MSSDPRPRGDVPDGFDESAADDERPISVRLGQVVPPEDPEDWTRPLTWVAALGMLAAPLAAAGWFLLWPPRDVGPAEVGTWVLAVLLAAGGVLTGITQRGSWRAFAGTAGAALFAGVAMVAVAASIGGRMADGVSPALSHATAAAVGGVVGAFAASPLMALFATHRSRIRLTAVPLALGSCAAIAVAALLMSPR